MSHAYLLALALGLWASTSAALSAQAQEALAGAGAAEEDPLVVYRRDKEKLDTWHGPFMRPMTINTDQGPRCAKLAPGFDPEFLRLQRSFRKIRRMIQVEKLVQAGPSPDGQKVLVIAPRFGLGNTLRNWVSAFYWGLFSGRRIVLLHAGKFHGVFTSLCLAFRCEFDHIWPPRSLSHQDHQASAVALLDVLEQRVQPRRVAQSVALEALRWEDPVVLSYSYAFWDHWWLNNRSLAACGCGAVGGCRGGGGLRSKALHALIGLGPTDALGETIENVLRRHQPHPARIVLVPRTRERTVEGQAEEGDSGEGSREEAAAAAAAMDTPQLAAAMVALWSEYLQPASSGVAMQFDVGLHIRTRTSILERPGRPFGGCKGELCAEKKQQELATLRERYLNARTWRCIGLFLSWVAGLQGPDNVRPLSIFLATDNQVMRAKFVRRLSRYGVVYYNGAEVAHVGVSGTRDKGRLPTMAEFYLLGKSNIIVELDQYMSTFSYFSGLLGNGTILNLPYNLLTPASCNRRKPVQVGTWSPDDPRATHNSLFSIGP